MSTIYKTTSLENLGEIGRKLMIQKSTNGQSVILTIVGIATGVLIASIILKYKSEKNEK